MKRFVEGILLGNDVSGAYLKARRAYLSSNRPLLWQPSELSVAEGTSDISQTPVFCVRTRVTVAEMNAGKTLLGAYSGGKWKIADVKVIAIGGNASSTAATGLAIYGTQAGTATALFSVLKAALTQHAVNQINTANTSVANSGALFAANDVNTAITCKTTTASDFDLATATHFDVILSVSLEV